MSFTFTFKIEYVALASLVVFGLIGILQLVGASAVQQYHDTSNKPLAIYWELFLYVSFLPTVIGAVISAGLLIAFT